MFILISVNEQERNNFDGYENNEVVHKMYETIENDINIEQANSKLCNLTIYNHYELKKLQLKFL